MMSRLRPFADLLLALGLLLAFDLVAFHCGAYFPYLRPESHSGRVERGFARWAFRQSQTPLRQVVVMGDSTGAHSIEEVLLEQRLQAAGWPLAATNLAIGGSTARSWKHLLEDAGVERENTALVVLGVFPLGLQETQDKPDMKILKTRLRLSDVAALPASFEKTEARLQATTEVFYRTGLFRDDLLELLRAPRARLAEVETARAADQAQRGQGWRRYNKSRLSFASARLGADGKLDRAVLDEWIRRDPALMKRLEELLQRRASGFKAAQPIKIEPGQARMLAEAIRWIASQDIPVVVALTPEGPLPPLRDPGNPFEPLVDGLRAEGIKVRLFRDVALLASLEKPEYFEDLLHANQASAEIYTRGLADWLAEKLGSELEIEERRGVVGSEEHRDPHQESDAQAAQQ
jgi:hypothetical protein